MRTQGNKMEGKALIKNIISHVNCLLLATVCSLMFGPTELIVYNDAVFNSNNELYVIGYQQPIWGANSMTSNLVLVSPQNYAITKPTKTEEIEARRQYPYHSTNGVFSRYLFIISLFTFFTLSALLSDRRKYYLKSTPSIEELHSYLNELSHSYVDLVRFFWIKPILKRRIAQNIKRKITLFQLLKSSFNQFTTHSDLKRNAFFLIIDSALDKQISVIKVKVTLDDSNKVKTRQLNQDKSEYINTSRNPTGIYKRLQAQLHSQDTTNPIQHVLNKDVSFLDGSTTLLQEIDYSIINGLNNLVNLFNLDNIIKFEPCLPNEEHQCEIIVESVISEHNHNGLQIINNSKTKEGGIFTFDATDSDTPLAYIRPSYSFLIKIDEHQIRYPIQHKYSLIDLIVNGSDYKRMLTEKLLPLDANFAVSQFLLATLKLPTNYGLQLEPFNPQIIKNRDHDLKIRQKLRLTMESLSNQTSLKISQTELENRYRLYSNAYCSAILNSNAQMVRNEVYYSSINKFNLKHQIF